MKVQANPTQPRFATTSATVPTFFSSSLTSGLEAGVEGARPPLVVLIAPVDLGQRAVRLLSAQRFARDWGEPVGGVDSEVGNALLRPIVSSVMKVTCKRKILIIFLSLWF